MAPPSHLPPVASAGKDCRNCNTRRIRCDRTLPFCTKCSKKRLTCPGYERPLRWTNAIASRGRFRGRGEPTTPDDDSAKRTDVTAVSEDPDPGFETIVSPHSIATSITELFGESALRHLLHHYASTITPMMVWIDSEKNEYRRLILPLSESQPVLKLAILVTSATHSLSDTHVDENLIQSAYEAAIAMITERVKDLTRGSESEVTSLEINVTDIKAVLAAILVLSNYSLIRSSLSVAQFHRQAARVLIKTLDSVTTSGNETDRFLKNQVAAYDVLACTTLFQHGSIEDAILPGSNFSLFGLLLKNVHAITMWPRQLACEDFTPQLHSIREVESQFEVARGATLLAAGPLIEHRTESFKHDFIQLVATYHHAGILYAYKRLESFAFDEHARHHLNGLFEALDRLKDMSLFLASIQWPLFIGGLCCCDDSDKQRKVRSFYAVLSANTRYQYYNAVAGALEEIWESQHHDWTVVARNCEDKGEPIIPV